MMDSTPSADSSATRYFTSPEIWRVPTFSAAVSAPASGSRVFLSAQNALDQSGKLAGDPDARRQIDQTFANLRRALSAAGLVPACIVRVVHLFAEYEVDLLKTIFRNLEETFPADRMPSSTGLVVMGFAQPGLKYELLAEGFLPSGPAST